MYAGLPLAQPGPGGLTPLHLAAVLPAPAAAALDLLSGLAAEALPAWFSVAARDGCTPAHYASRAGNSHLNDHALLCLALGLGTAALDVELGAAAGGAGRGTEGAGVGAGGQGQWGTSSVMQVRGAGAGHGAVVSVSESVSCWGTRDGVQWRAWAIVCCGAWARRPASQPGAALTSPLASPHCPSPTVPGGLWHYIDCDVRLAWKATPPRALLPLLNGGTPLVYFGFGMKYPPCHFLITS